MTIGSKSDIAFRVIRKPSPSPEVKKRFDTSLVVVFVALWETDQINENVYICCFSQAKSET